MRKETTITLDDRDKKLTFRIREMSATKAESWLMRAIMLLAPSMGKNANLADLSGLEANTLLRALGGIKYEDAKPLLDELLECCARIDGGIEQKCTLESVDGFIEDPKTLFSLRIEAAKLNFSFFGSAAA